MHFLVLVFVCERIFSAQRDFRWCFCVCASVFCVNMHFLMLFVCMRKHSLSAHVLIGAIFMYAQAFSVCTCTIRCCFCVCTSIFWAHNHFSVLFLCMRKLFCVHMHFSMLCLWMCKHLLCAHPPFGAVFENAESFCVCTWTFSCCVCVCAGISIVHMHLLMLLLWLRKHFLCAQALFSAVLCMLNHILCALHVLVLFCVCASIFGVQMHFLVMFLCKCKCFRCEHALFSAVCVPKSACAHRSCMLIHINSTEKCMYTHKLLAHAKNSNIDCLCYTEIACACTNSAPKCACSHKKC